MAIYREDYVDIDLANNGSIFRSFANRAIGKGDIKENRFGVRLFRNGEPVNLNQTTCQGFFMAPDGQNILISGSGSTGVEDNLAWVQLPQACYNVEGQFTLAIKVLDSSVTGTMRIVDGMVDNTGTNSPVAPTSSVPTYSEILSTYDLMLEALDSGLILKQEAGISDLNDVTDSGYYFLDSTYDYDNLPAGIRPHTFGALYLKVYALNEYYVVQELTITSNIYRGMKFIRRKDGDTWFDWINPPFGNIPWDISDLNDAKTAGFYFLAASYDYPNLPPEIKPHTSGALTLRVYADADESFLQQELAMYSGPFTGSVYQRRFVQNTWYSWYKISDAQSLESVNRTEMESITPVSMASQGENVGTNIRVMTYNVAHFDNDINVYLPDNKLFNLKKVLGYANADFLLIQEGNKYIDGPEESGTKLTSSYLFAPIYPAVYGDGSCVIASKQNLTEWGILEYTNGRVLRYGLYEQGSIKLLLVSTHPVWDYSGGGDSEESIAARKTQYKELFKWVNGQISLNRFETTTPVYAPTHTHCVIGMDANCSLARDKTNLLTEAGSGNFIAGNGGALGWFYTAYSRGMTEKDSIDCIFVSPNIIINNIEAYGDWFERLYSDHVPVVADLTLL